MFVLVNPPFVNPWRPNLGISLLKAQLQKDGHPCRAYYADHELAARWGLSAYSRVLEDHGAMVGEWLFSGLVRSRGDWDLGFLSFLEARGFQPQELQTLVSWTGELGAYVQDTARQILSMAPTVVGCSSTFQQNNASLALLRALKDLDPAVVTVMGGANLEGELGEPILDYPWIDYLVSGEAEECISPFYALCRKYGRQIPEELLPAEVARAGGRPGRRGNVRNLDDLPYPDFQDCFESLRGRAELAEIEPVLTLEGSRGCWWGQVSHCTFCGLNGNGLAYRAKAPQRLLAEIRELSQRHGRQHIEMVDNIIAPRHLKELLPELARENSGLRFFWEVKANLKAAHFQLLRQAGVVWLQPGIESLSDHVLGLMRKGQRSLQNLLVLKAARENGIKLSWNLLVRHPGETVEDLRHQADLVPFLRHLQPPSDVCEVRADRFSPLFAENPELQPFEVYAYLYDREPADLRKLAYYFDVHAGKKLPAGGYRSAVRRLERLVGQWKADFWRQPESLGLYFSGEGVLDQRDPAGRKEHPLSPEERKLLEASAQPVKLAELGPQVDQLLPRLLELGLAYRDETHLLSLVLAQEPALLPPMVAAH